MRARSFVAALLGIALGIAAGLGVGALLGAEDSLPSVIAAVTVSAIVGSRPRRRR